MSKNKNIFMVFIAINLVSLNCVNGQAESRKNENIIEEFARRIHEGDIYKVESLFLGWNTTTKITSPEDEENVTTHLVCRTPRLQPLYYVLKYCENKKKDTCYEKIGLTIRFYDSAGAAFSIRLARQVPVVLINNEAYEPTSQMMQALKYFMPYEAYEEISQSGEYYKYFNDVKDNSEKVEAKQSEPNTLNK